MPVISTNLAANSAVRYLNINSASQTSSLSKLASGSRITQASDDAAGLAISTKISSDVTALSQAATNASHGISVLQTADGGASNISDILQRMKALASQSASGTVTDNERVYIDAIAVGTRYNGQSLLDGTSAFAAGINVMVGSDAADTISVVLDKLNAQGLALSASAGVTDAGTAAAGPSAAVATGTIALSGMNLVGDPAVSTGSSPLGLFTVINPSSFDINGLTVNLSPTGGTFGAPGSGNYDAQDIVDAINLYAGSVVTASLDGTDALILTSVATGGAATFTLNNFAGDFVSGAMDLGFASATETANGSDDTVFTNINSYSVNFSSSGGPAGDGVYSAQDIVDEINAQASAVVTASLVSGMLSLQSVATGLTAEVQMTAGDAAWYGFAGAVAAGGSDTTTATAAELTGGTAGVSITAETSFNINGTKVTLTNTGGTAGNGVYTAQDLVDAITAAAPTGVTASLVAGAVTLTSAITGATAGISVDNFTNGTAATILGISGGTTVAAVSQSTSTQAKAITAIGVLDTALTTVSAARADIGSLESRFGFHQASIATSIENLTAAVSAIKDTDVAQEAAKMASSKVKTQAAVAAAAQASQMPQDLLKLLQ